MAESTEFRTQLEGYEALPLANACEELQEWLAALPNRAVKKGVSSVWVSRTVSIERIDPLAWLWEQSISPRCYWGARDRAITFAAAGAADRIVYHGSDPREIIDTVSKAAVLAPKSAFYIGGLRFDCSSERESQEWAAFAHSQFILPALSVRSADGRSYLTATAQIGGNNEDLRVLLTTSRESSGVSPRVAWKEAEFSFSELPARQEWEGKVETLLRQIKDHHLKKLVLSRLISVSADFPIDPLHLLLRARESALYGASFLFEPEEGSSFVGHSPELLYSRDGCRIESEAVAGTRKRGSDEDDDTRLARDLLSSDKDRREHGLVSLHVADALHSLCDELTLPGEPLVRKLARVQHLVSPFCGRLKNGVTDADIVGALYPTPAVSGAPVPEAIAQIGQIELHDRGWYAGLVGTVSKERTEFAVAIRSALVTKNEARLYAGSGIVEGSDPSSEWEETGQKLGGFLRALTDP